MSATWASVLADNVEIARLVESQSPDWVDFDRILDEFIGTRAVLRMVPITGLSLSAEDHHAKVDKKQRRYARLAPDTRPPLLVDTSGEVRDGNHRLRDAIARGETTILCYVIEDEVDDDVDDLSRLRGAQRR